MFLTKNTNAFLKINKENIILKIFASIGFIFIIFFAVVILRSANFFPHNINSTLDYLSYRLVGDPDHSVNNFYELSEVVSLGLKQKLNFASKKAENLNITINHEDVLRLNSYLKSGNKNYVPAKISLDNEDSLKVKVRVKGDRMIHRSSFESMSYRVNVRGKNMFKGFDKFSIQHPMIRNYSWEYLFSDTAKKEGLLTLEMGLINLSVNGEERGLYTYEEVPQKETIERNFRKNGPIFGLDEPLGESYPNIFFELYEEDYWKADGRATLKTAIQKLDQLKVIDSDSENFEETLSSIMDIEKWASFFALTDLFNAYHGAILKSVKLYYNPSTGLIEPLVFDAHIGAGKYESFFFLDYMLSSKTDCYPICNNNDWFKIFFNQNNKNFIEKYTNNLTKYTSNTYLESISKNYDNNFLKFTKMFYSNFMSSDAIFFEGLGLHHFNINNIFKRAAKIKNRLSNFQISLGNEDESLKVNDSSFGYSSNEASISLFENYTFEGTKLSFSSPTIIMLKGITNINGLDKNNPLRVTGPVTIVQLNGEINLSYVIFEDGKSFSVLGTNWTGALNFINSNVNLKNITVINNDSEDAINSVGSNLTATSLNFYGSRSDALDIDFGDFQIESIKCSNIGNDCIDLSGATGKVDSLEGDIVGDKLISGGEKSIVFFDNVISKSAAIAVVSKDSSRVSIDSLILSQTKLSGAIFVKKTFFSQPFLDIRNIDSFDNPPIFLINDLSAFSAPVNSQNIIVKPSEEIEDLMYGNEYGAATVR